jgi:hypothetical protein
MIYFSTVLSAAVFVGSGLIYDLEGLYSRDLALRQQAESLFAGRLGLSESVGDVSHDHVWDNGRVQQVWGLGVPAWRVPFEAAARFPSFDRSGSGDNSGGVVFPDRIAFGVAHVLVVIMVMVAFTGTTARRDLRVWLRYVLEEREKAAALFLLALFPPFMTLLNSGRFSVYSEVQAYSYLVGVGLLAGTMLFVRNPRFRMFLAIAAVGGLAAFVRPTAGIFGVVALVVLLIRALSLGWSWWRMGTGVGLFLAGGVLLYLTNWLRFGAGFEFGHNLNLNELYTMRFAGRFEAPYRSEPILSAARELGSLLFYEEGYRSDTLRWRQITFAIYNLTYLLPLIAVAAWFADRCRRIIANRKVTFGETDVLAFWFVTCTFPLLLFYLRFPFMNSRYLLDFAPGFAAGMLAFVYILRDWGVPRLGRRFRTFLLAGIVAWWGYQVIFVSDIGRGTIRNPAITREAVIERMERAPWVYSETPAYYETGMRFLEYFNSHNGSGWDSYSGNTRASLALFVEDPEFLELTVAPIDGVTLSLEDYEIIRAKVALEFLELESMTPTEEGMVLRFSGPKRKRYQSGIQVVFIGFMTAEELHEGWSRFRLLRVEWNHASLDST